MANMLIDHYELEMFSPPCDPGSPIWVGRLITGVDLGPVMPYINASVKNAFYDEKVPTIVYKEGDYKHALRDGVISIKNFKDRAHAERVGKKAVERINDIWERREEIEPNYTTRVAPKLLDILKLLPRTNCKDCGCLTCMAFAAQLVEGDKLLEGCPPLREPGMEENMGKLRELGL
jgi:ArsR family metal-binding transcriptional regulator